MRSMTLVFAILSQLVLAGPSSARDAEAPQPKALQAIFLEVDGKVRWRRDAGSDWRDARVNDLVDPGAEIRTGLRSRAALRVGRNATILVDAGTSFQIPQLEQEGDTLRTLASVKTGRVDFKVDRVGYANDFKVATPQTTLSVRGTGFGVNTGPLAGSEVVGARTNMINAIELKYVASNLKYFMSGAASSSSGNPDPVKNAWLGTLGPPQVAGTIADPGQLEQAASQGQAGNAPTNSQAAQQIGAAESRDLPRTEGSPILSLLRMQEGELDNLKSSTTQILDGSSTPPLAGSARAKIEQAHAAAVAQQAGIAAAIDAQESMEPAFTELSGLDADSRSNLESMGTLRASMEQAIAADDDAGVTAVLDQMGEIDDAWQGQLKARALELVNSLGSLQQDLESAAAAAQSSDVTFNALLPEAQASLSVLQATADSLEGFQSSIEAYQRAVVAAFRSGEVGADSMRQLRRSVEILQESSQRITAALAALQGAAERLADAQSIIEQGQALSLAITALLRGQDISALVPTLQSNIDENAAAIESARFSAFFAAVSAGVAAIGERSDIASLDGEDSSKTSAEALGLATAVEADIASIPTLAAAMDQFWNEPGSGQEISPKARMEALLSQSEGDRASMASMLVTLNDHIAAVDEAAAAQTLGDMRSLDSQWQATETGLMAETNGIHVAMQSRLEELQTTIDRVNGFEASFEGLMASASDKQATSQAAAARATDLLQRIQSYQQVYEALKAEGRGVAQIDAAAALIGGSLAAYNAGQSKAAAAAAAAENARSNGQRVLNAAAANALQHQAALTLATSLATASQTLRDAIQANVTLMHDDVLTGENNYNAAFGTGGRR